MGEDSTSPRSGRRMTVDEAARALGLSVDAIRKRVQRGQIAHEKDDAGRVRIILDEPETLRDTLQDQSQSEALISEMRSHLEDLRTQLEHERAAHAEARRLLAAALERISPAIEAPSEPPEPHVSAVTDEEAEEALGGPGSGTARGSWWRRMFGG